MLLSVRPSAVYVMFRANDHAKEGSEIWVAAENAYNERVARVENQIIARLRDRLGTARNANEMFRVFSKFNALFVRPKASSPLKMQYIYFGTKSIHIRSAGPFKSIRHNSLILSKKTSNDCTTRRG